MNWLLCRLCVRAHVEFARRHDDELRALRAPTSVDDLILDEYAHVFAGDAPPVAERWTGTYASAKDRLTLVDKPSDALRIVLVTSGTGASISFALAEEVLADLFG